MDFLSSLLVGSPLRIFSVAGLFVAAYFLMRRSRFGSDRQPKYFLIPAGAWTIYAAWEWLVLVKTPEANIRIDLLAIWPVLLIISIWYTIKALRKVDGLLK